MFIFFYGSDSVDYPRLSTIKVKLFPGGLRYKIYQLMTDVIITGAAVWNLC